MNAADRLPRISADDAASAIKARAEAMARVSPLYGALGKQLVETSDLLALTAHGLGLMPELHLFVAVHYLIARHPRDPLARYFASLTESPLPPDDAFPVFARFCRAHREEILNLFKTRTIQMTMVERCQTIMPSISTIADKIGEPMNLIEIGCSAGVLLTFDKYAYDIKGRGRIGTENTPLTLGMDVQGGPVLRIPRIGKRIGIDLCPIDVKVEDERRWLLAQLWPEQHGQRARLESVLEVVGDTGIEFFRGDALDLLPDLIARTPSPLCIYHSACVVYWSEESKAALDALLLQASLEREFYRVGVEAASGKVSTNGNLYAEVVIEHYRNGAVDGTIAATCSADSATFTWLD